MSLDIVEIALDNLTDHVEFEKIASEIMRAQGYRNIQPLGGVSDKSRDAIQESHEINKARNVTVFQYTLEGYLPGKIRDTIDKLNSAKIEYNELVVVTPHSISTERQDQMKIDARNNYDVSLTIYERKTIVNRLANFENDIFYRHFPDIEKQINTLISRKPLLSADDASLLETAMLKSSLVFSVGKETPRVRNTIFDSLTSSIILQSSAEKLSVGEILSQYIKSTGLQIPPAQLEASLGRLTSKGLLSRKAEYVIITKFAKQYEAANTVRANEATASLISDVLQQITHISSNKLSQTELETISINTRETLIKLFTLFGIELSERILKDKVSQANYLELSEELVNTTKSNLSPELANLLISIISQIIKHPTEEQAQILSYWSLSYIGVQIMNLDPNLRQLQEVRFSHKIFILDTDFILDCIVRECPLSHVYLELIKTLRNYGCRVIIPKSCINECITHAKISYRTYNHFGDKLLSLMDILVDEGVWNIFVKGYYYGRRENKISSKTSYPEYLRNYYEPRSPESFFIDIIKTTFPEGTEIAELESLLSDELPDDLMKLMSDALMEIHSSTLKSKYRSQEDELQLAKTDARLFLTALYKSQSSDEITDEILGGCCYLITSSSKYIRATKNISIRDVVTTRPQTLVALLDVIGGIKIEPQDFVRLFENPLLINAVRQSWDDVEVLLDSGVDLRDKSLPRLRWDLDQELHSKISALAEAELRAETAEEAAIITADNEFTELLKSASSRGYKSIPELEVFLRALEVKDLKAEEMEQAYNELLQRFGELETEIAHFGKRKQNYLKRVARQQEKS